MNAEWNVNGALYPETARVRLLKGTAKIKAENGILRTVDVQENINSAMDKVPFLKGKRVKVDDGFKLLSADIKFNDGIVDVNPILITPKGKGFEIKGKSRIEAATAMLEQESFLDVYDPQGQLPKEISKPGQVAIAIRVHGPLSSPKTDYEYTVKKLAGTAAKGAAKSVLQDLGKKFLGGAEKSDKPADAVKGLTDKLKKFKF